MRRFTLLVLTLTPIAHPAAMQADHALGSSPSAGGVEARFDIDGAWVSVPGATPTRVRTVQFGRPGATEAVERAVPTEVGCASRGAGCTPRVEYGGAGLTEWWSPAPGGLEQGWTVWRRPGGNGPLQIGVHAAALASAQPGGIQLSGPAGAHGGRDLHVGELVAWDARGRDLLAHFEPTDDGFLVVVDDADALYPVQVDPLYTAPDWSVEGDHGYIGSGLAGRAIGDVTGDGYDDVTVEGYVFFGSAAGIETDAGQDLGISTEWAGDVNGDGFDDVEASGDIYSGGPDGIGSVPAQSFDGALTPVGDLGGDGYADLVYVNFEGTQTVTTSVCVVTGSASGAVDAGGCVGIAYTSSDDWQAATFIGADFDGDDKSELLYGYATSDIAGSLVSILHDDALCQHYYDPTLPTVASAGDVDGDGADEPMFDMPTCPARSS